MALADQFRALAGQASDEADQLVGERMTGVSLHFLGDQAGARACIARVLNRHDTAVNWSHIVRFQRTGLLSGRTPRSVTKLSASDTPRLRTRR